MIESKKDKYNKIFSFSVAIVLFFPLLNIFFIYPKFKQQIISNTENEAIRTANFIISHEKIKDKGINNQSLFNEMKEIKNTFNLYKVKIFEPSGKIIYSSSESDFGKMNTKSYFHNIVAKGEVFTKLVKKQQKSLENEVIIQDVIETYVPVMDDDKHFIGAFELYYIISDRMKSLSHIIIYSTIISSILALLFLVIIYYLKKQSNKFIDNEIKYQENLDKARISAESANQYKSKFLAMISHEIRSPLTAISGFTDLFFDTKLDDEQKNLIQDIKDSSEFLLDIINDILDISKIEANRLDLECTTFDLHSLISNTFNIMQFKAKDKNIDCKLDLQTSIPKFVKSDPTRIKQIIINLLSNAIKFTEKGSVLLSIKKEQISDSKNSDNTSIISIRVKDTGIGISKEYQKDIFTPFSQEDLSITRKYGGTGLGLSIIKSLTEMMNGSVSIQSEKNIGTEIICKIKVENTTAENQINSIEKDPLIKPSYTLEHLNILIADDSKINQKLLKRVLNKYKISMSFVNNGEETINKLKEDNNYDLIIIDIQMPVMDGLKATEIIRNELHSSIPIIGLSANAMEEDKAEALNCGMTDYLTKPIKINQMLEVINKLSKQ